MGSPARKNLLILNTYGIIWKLAPYKDDNRLYRPDKLAVNLRSGERVVLGLFIMMCGVATIELYLLVAAYMQLRKEQEELRLIRQFIEQILLKDYQVIQVITDKMLESRASDLERVVQRSIRFQKGGLAALGIPDTDRGTGSLEDEVNQKRYETIRRNVTEEDVKYTKKEFWALYDLVEKIGHEFGVAVRTPRSYKNYLPTNKPQ